MKPITEIYQMFHLHSVSQNIKYVIFDIEIEIVIRDLSKAQESSRHWQA